MPQTSTETLSSRSLISALTDPSALKVIRGRFEGMAFETGLRGLVVELIDPQLLRVVLGPRLAPRWALGLEKLYKSMRERYPSQFPDIDQSWHRQRNYWHSLLRSARRAAEAADEEAEAASAASGAHGDVVERTQGVPVRPGFRRRRTAGP